MNDKESILNLKHGKCYVVSKNDYSRAEIWFLNDAYILFEIPVFGGKPQFVDGFFNVDCLIREYESWT